ncbi:PAS domain-containing sensor histidine kinase [Nocardioides rubriscoriae]|uniref:sensor histidine kinase n=1 Tax=Nocardioides rubriscoriae TaxID=642762 RepID=UPI0014785BA0|nr:PAS domain-containing sensor histidine kinase [Nocardioides rubriscoriae]
MRSFPQGALFAFDHDLRYLCAGGQGLADVGLSREMLEGRTLFEAFPDETAAVIEPQYRTALSGDSTARDIAYEGRTYSQRLAPVRDDMGHVVAGLGVCVDVTEARRAEHALRVSVQQNRLTFEHAPIGIAIVELDGTWREVNPAVTRFTEYTEEELLGLTFQEITHPDDLELDLEHVGRLVAGEIGSYQIDKRYITKSGRTVWALLSVALVRDIDGSPLHFVSQIQEVTDSRRAHQALQDLTAMLAHDLRTPAAVMLGFAELLEGLSGAEMQAVREYASRISAGARAMTEMLDNVLAATVLDAGQVVASPQAVPLRDSLDLVVHALTAHPVVIDTSGVDDVGAWVDPVHLQQVLTNLLTNAVKYGGDTINVTATSRRGRVTIAVTDDGPGVPPDFVPHLFDRYSRSTQARDGLRRGSGLGLYIVRDLLAANAGTITYAPSPIGGATFTVELPEAPARLL